MQRLVVVLLILGLVGGWHWWRTERPVHHGSGAIAPGDPMQTDLDPPEKFVAKGYSFDKRARFDITARLLRKERYRIDAEAALAPFDLGVGWGPASDSEVIDQLQFSQMGRFFYWQPKNASFPLSQTELNRHMAQIHVIPSTEALADRLAGLRPGQLISAHGYLVDVRGAGGFLWRTSLTRDDSGDGACEILWLESLEAD